MVKQHTWIYLRHLHRNWWPRGAQHALHRSWLICNSPPTARSLWLQPSDKKQSIVWTWYHGIRTWPPWRLSNFKIINFLDFKTQTLNYSQTDLSSDGLHFAFDHQKKPPTLLSIIKLLSWSDALTCFRACCTRLFLVLSPWKTSLWKVCKYTLHTNTYFFQKLNTAIKQMFQPTKTFKHSLTSKKQLKNILQLQKVNNSAQNIWPTYASCMERHTWKW